MKVDAGDFHDAEDAGQDQRNAEGDDQSRPQPQGDETDDEDDGDGFPQRFCKVTDGLFDDLRLVRDLVHFHPGRKVGFDAVLKFLQVFAELQIVAAALHGQGDADGGLAVIEHLRISRFAVTPFYGAMSPRRKTRPLALMGRLRMPSTSLKTPDRRR